MPLKLTIPNKAIPAFIALAILISLAGVVAYTVSLGPIPDPGHSLAQIQGYFSGDASLEDSLGKLQQRVSGACAAGSSIRAVNQDGTVSCELDDTSSGAVGAVMYLESALTPPACPSGWAEAAYTYVNLGTYSTRRSNVRACYRTDRACLVIYLRQAAANPPACPSGWSQAALDQAYAPYTTTNGGPINLVRTCYRC